MRRRSLLIATMFLQAFALGCGSDDNDPTGPAASASVEMRNSQFVPASVTVARGGTVTWTNRDNINHNVSGIAGLNAGDFGLNGTRTFTFAAAGTFNYTCTLHSGMNGTVIVQ